MDFRAMVRKMTGSANDFQVALVIGSTTFRESLSMVQFEPPRTAATLATETGPLDQARAELAPPNGLVDSS